MAGLFGERERDGESRAPAQAGSGLCCLATTHTPVAGQPEEGAGEQRALAVVGALTSGISAAATGRHGVSRGGSPPTLVGVKFGRPARLHRVWWGLAQCTQPLTSVPATTIG